MQVWPKDGKAVLAGDAGVSEETRDRGRVPGVLYQGVDGRQ